MRAREREREFVSFFFFFARSLSLSLSPSPSLSPLYHFLFCKKISKKKENTSWNARRASFFLKKFQTLFLHYFSKPLSVSLPG